jgi:hypothetical protein
MTDIMQNYRFQQLLMQAARYQTIRQVFKSDPSFGPKTATIIRDCLRADRDDVEVLRAALKKR